MRSAQRPSRPRAFSTQPIGQRLIVSECSVKTHVSRILMKLGLRDRAQAVIAPYEFGLVSAGDSP